MKFFRYGFDDISSAFDFFPLDGNICAISLEYNEKFGDRTHKGFGKFRFRIEEIFEKFTKDSKNSHHSREGEKSEYVKLTKYYMVVYTKYMPTGLLIGLSCDFYFALAYKLQKKLDKSVGKLYIKIS